MSQQRIADQIQEKITNTKSQLIRLKISLYLIITAQVLSLTTMLYGLYLVNFGWAMAFFGFILFAINAQLMEILKARVEVSRLGITGVITLIANLQKKFGRESIH